MTQSQQPDITEDFLEADDEIRGQNYACLSFVSPESVLKNKELFFMQKFLKHILDEKKLDESYINDLEDKYKDFMYKRQDDFEKEFCERQDFQTTIRGVKVRGVYDSLKEAQIRAKILQRRDKNFNVFVGQVGYWLPWDPHPHKVENQEYFESELNELVKKYKENQEDKADHFRENVEYVKEQAAKKAEKDKSEKATNLEKENSDSGDSKLEGTNTEKGSDSITSNNTLDSGLQQSLEEDDPWVAAKKKRDEESNINNTNESKNL